MGEILNDTVNSIEKNFKSTAHSNTVNSSKTLNEKIEELVMEENASSEGIALMLAEGLDDLKSLSWYKLLAKEHNHSKLLEVMAIVNLAHREGKIRTSKVHYFRGILGKIGYKVKFSDND